MKVTIEIAYGEPDSIDLIAAEMAAEQALDRFADPLSTEAMEAAQRAGDTALTSGWADPDGAGCFVHVNA